MEKLKSVYIVEQYDQGWIIERLMRDIAEQLEKQGVNVAIGKIEGYSGEQVLLNSRYQLPFFDKRSKINSLFLTHIDDSIKELEVKNIAKKFDSILCLSPQDARYLSALIGNDNKTSLIGIELPTRNDKVKPLNIAIFSARYKDGRKNEFWLVEHFKNKSTEYKNGFVIVLMGWGWEDFAKDLNDLDVNYNIIRYSRSMPGEYHAYKELLSAMDVMIYMGFDGGTMSVYDGIAAGVDVVVPNFSFHKELGSCVQTFDTQQEFYTILDSYYKKYSDRLIALQSRSIKVYVEKLMSHYNDLLSGCKQISISDLSVNKNIQIADLDPNVLETFRSHYQRLSYERLRSYFIRKIQKLYFLFRGN